jgi:hypothetical protein
MGCLEDHCECDERVRSGFRRTGRNGAQRGSVAVPSLLLANRYFDACITGTFYVDAIGHCMARDETTYSVTADGVTTGFF